MIDRPSDSPRSLARSMAEATGLNLAKAQRSGLLSADEVSDLFQSCRRCDHWQDCPSWLNDQGPGATRAPGYCRNRAVFDRIRRRRIARALA